MTTPSAVPFRAICVALQCCKSRIWMLAFCLLSAEMVHAQSYYFPFPPSDQIVAQNGSTGPLFVYTPAQYFSVKSDNQTLVPNDSIVVVAQAHTVTITPVAGQYGRAVITVSARWYPDSPDVLESFSFNVDVPMPVLAEGGMAGTSNLATRGTAFAKDLLPGYAAHSIPHLNDGIYGNANSWIGNCETTHEDTFAGISFGSRAVPVNQLAFGRDNTGAAVDRVNSLFVIEYTTVPNPSAATPKEDWVFIGSVYPPFLAYPSKRHLVAFPTVMATAFRVFMPLDRSGFSEIVSPAIDEIELYHVTTGPMVVAPDNQSIPINTGTAVLRFTTSEEPNLTVSASSSDPSFVPNSNIVLGGPVGDRSVQVTPVANRSGTALITLTVSDGVQSATDQFRVSTSPNLLKEGGTFRNGNLAAGGTAFAKNVLPGWVEHTIAHLNDGFYSRENSWIAGSANSFAGINLGAVSVPINCVAFGRDNTGVWTDRALGTYTVQYTTVPNPDANTPDTNWISIVQLETANFAFPARRHLLSFPEISATGIRILTGPDGTCIDEVEIYRQMPAIAAPVDQLIYPLVGMPALSTAALPYSTSQEAGLSVTASSSNPALVPNSNIVLGGSGPNRTVTVTSLPAQTGSATITLTVSDGSQSTSDTFTFTVVPLAIYNASDSASFASAIQSANVSVATPVVRLTGSFTQSSAPPFLTRSMIVDGGGFTINGGGYSGLVVGDGGNAAVTPEVAIKDLTIFGAKAVGGNALRGIYRGGGGGGAGGFGGALFVSRGSTVHLQNVNLLSNQAQGGWAAIDSVFFGDEGLPGGNGLGSGSFGRGAAGGSFTFYLDAGHFPFSVSGGAAGLGFGSGGGGGGTAEVYSYSPGSGGVGGIGGYGGGGGGGGSDGTPGAKGGFGGGSAIGHFGGQGAGLGGAMFVQMDATVQIAGSMGVSGNAVFGGTGAGGAGSAFGSGIFFQGNHSMTFSPESNTLSQLIGDGIADESGSSGGGVGATGKLSVIKNGPGTTILGGPNTYAGSTTIEAGLFRLTGSQTSAITNHAIFGPYHVANTTGIYTQTAAGTFQVYDTSDRLDAASVSLAGNLEIGIVPGAPTGPITIINNAGSNPVTGTFNGFPEGRRFGSNGNVFQISYVGGTGNDVVLTPAPPFEIVGDGGTATTSNLAARGTAFAKDLLPGYPNHSIPHLNDSLYGNASSWISNSANSFAGISFGTRAIAVNQVAFGRDNTGAITDRAIGLYTIQYTTAPNPSQNTPDSSWISIGTINTATLPHPALRHVFNFPTLLVTGIRIITAVDGTAIDEIEIYNAIDGLQVVAPDHQTIAVDTSTAALPFTTSADSNLTFSASSDNPALIPASNIIFSGMAGHRTVMLTPLAGRTGTASITLTISDGVATASDSFLLTVPTNTSVTGLFGYGLHMEAANNTAGMPNLALVVNGGSAFAKDVLPVYPSPQIGISYLNDGVYGNPSSWIGNSVSSFAGINLGGLKKINRVAFGRDNTGVLADLRWNGIYTIQYTTVANPDANTASWTTIGVIDRGYAPYFFPPSILRQLFSFPPVMATGVRILTVAAAGSPHPLAIDELEIYNVTGPDIMVEQVAYKPLLPGLSILDFGAVAQMSASTIQLTITNPGTANLELGTISKWNAQEADFTFGTPGTTTIPPGGSTTLPLTFAPGAPGVRNALFSIASNATGVKTNFNFSGTGTGVGIAPPAAGISSGLTLVQTGGSFAAGNLATAAGGGTAFAKDVLLINPHTIGGLNDGVYGNPNSWINSSANSFGGINLGGLKWFDRIAFGRDNAIPQTQLTRAVGLYVLQYTTANNPDASTTNWTTIGTVDLGYTALFGTEGSGGPAKRHLFSFAPVQATGMRIITVNDGACIDEIEIYPYFTPLETWRQLHFNTTANSGLAADNSDADKDGETNFAEFATGQNPTAGKRVGVSLSPNGSNWNLIYTRSIAALAAGVTFDVEMSDTLVANSWTTVVTGVPVVLMDNGLTQQVQVSVPTGGQPRRFYRLRITD